MGIVLAKHKMMPGSELGKSLCGIGIVSGMFMIPEPTSAITSNTEITELSGAEYHFPPPRLWKKLLIVEQVHKTKALWLMADIAQLRRHYINTVCPKLT
jgi:hypothetical protein